MRYLPLRITLFVALLAPALGGCSNEPAAKQRAARSVGPPHSLADTSKEPSGTQATQVETDQAAATVTPFRPPFPGRDEIFQPPRADQVAKVGPREEGTRIELRGFINVDGIRALLAVNGRVKSVKVGERFAGIDVVAISPPQVTLQQGRVRWTERLFPKH